MKILPCVVPYRGTRGMDAYGIGGFGSPREHKGREVKHLGVDLVSVVGDSIIAPITGVFSHTGPVYDWTGALNSVHIRGTGEYMPYSVVLYYVGPTATVGTTVSQGATIGIAEDVSGTWDERVKHIDEEWARALVRSGRRMTNHVHLELRLPDGQRINPTPYFDLGAVHA